MNIEHLKKGDEIEIWLFNKEGWLSVAENEMQMRQMRSALKVEPIKAKLIILE